MADISKIPTSQLVHDYLESYMDIARCELALLYPDSTTNSHIDIQFRLDANRGIVDVIAHELCNRENFGVFDRRELILGEFSV